MSQSDPYNFYINDGDSTEIFYYKMLPKSKPVAVLTIFPSGGEKIEDLLKQIELHEVAFKNDLLVIIPSYNWGTFQKTPDVQFIDSIFKQVILDHDVPKDKFVMCGLSNGGMISLTYGISAVRDSSTCITPLGIIGIDPPLDYARFYKYCQREVSRNFSEAGVTEAKWLLGIYNQIYQGSPEEYPQNYINASIFSYGEKDGGNTKYLNNIAIRMHSDLNVDFLINKRKRDLYDWNGTDIVAFVNQLKINGNKNAEVIITQNKGVRLDGTKNPHSWSIIDTDLTMKWILDLIK
ncbi:MAG TPA: hypothetical protein VJ917_11190 [Saprospiraceae bacterium]|nr:hypothetical protein [Saprospiraceae bacterium]